jgi:hypothetical protein
MTNRRSLFTGASKGGCFLAEAPELPDDAAVTVYEGERIGIKMLVNPAGDGEKLVKQNTRFSNMLINEARWLYERASGK